MYLLILAFGLVLLMHSFLLVSVLRKNEELNKKVNYLLKKGTPSFSIEGKRQSQSMPKKKAFQGETQSTRVKGARSLR